MELVLIEPTKNSPRVEIKVDGEITLKGRCFIEDSFNFFMPVIQCIKQHSFNSVKIDIQLEYLNTSGLVQIYSLFTLLKEKYGLNQIIINWYYEEGDEDIFEVGKTIESQINIPFNFYEFIEVD